MEASMITGFTDMELDDFSFIDHLLQVNSSSLEQIDLFGPPLLPSYEEDTYKKDTNYNQLQVKRSPQIDHHTIVEEKPLIKQHITNNWNSSYEIDHAFTSQDDDYSNMNMLSFSSSSSSINSQNCIPKATQVAKKSSAALASLSQQPKDHIIAERKRREKLNQRFIALTATIPGLKKMDKASVLGDAIKYVKQLEKQVKKLEEVTKTKTIESAVLVKRSRVFEEEENDQFIKEGPLYPEIEAKFSNKDVLIRINCEKKNGVVEKIISHIENLHLVVINSSTLVFGCSSIDATIIAQMDAEFSMTSKDLVRHLHAALKRLL
ncbi:transcription factor bHLH25-like [Chenopodium quinoa]|uniref:BHLH domain-containing protein n=1 Tax=Chenopodium quinoa TaxID=63459 RepID=A0A803MC71_CHEQI|nr:transcription factor bHLH25-like [Chenopodium quinoa]